MVDFLEIRTSNVNDYLYSYGGVSPFFVGLRDEKVIKGTRCPDCSNVYCPPRTKCPTCYVSTEWIDLPPTGTVVSAVDCYYVPPNYDLHRYLTLPYTLALIQLDGATTGLYSVVSTSGRHRQGLVRPGDRVRARFREQREGRLTDVYFVPEREAVDQ